MKATKFEWIKPPYIFGVESPFGAEWDKNGKMSGSLNKVIEQYKTTSEKK